MPLSYLVFDDFYTDPMAVRNEALALEYPTPTSRRNYPGRNSKQRLLVQGLEQIVSRIVNEPVKASPQDAHGHCRISLADDDPNRRYYVHVDPTAYWSGILYLTLPEHCQGGTEFYRHIATNTDRAPLLDNELAASGATSFGEAADPIIQKDSNDLSKWELLSTVPMRFNRLCLLRPWFWHTAGPSFGDGLHNGRLVQLFFFIKDPAR